VPVHIITQSGKKYDVFIQSQEKNPKVEKKVQIDSKPAAVIFNSGNKILCNLKFSKSKEDWLYQLKFSNDAIDRITALLGLRDFIDDDAVVNSVIEVMKSDKFWGVRLEAAKILSYSKNKKVHDVYLKSLTEEKDSRVRKSYITGIGNLYSVNPGLKEGDAVIQSFVVKLIDNETSYYAAAEGIAALARIVPKTQIYDLVLPYLNRDSHVDIIRRNVMYALDSADDQRTVDILLEYAEKGSNWRLRTAAVNGLGSFLDNQGVIDFLNRKVLEKDRHVQNAILALLERAANSSSKQYLEQLMVSSNDKGFKEKIGEILQKLD
jgi:aminopeptidase N